MIEFIFYTVMMLASMVSGWTLKQAVYEHRERKMDAIFTAIEHKKSPPVREGR